MRAISTWRNRGVPTPAVSVLVIGRTPVRMILVVIVGTALDMARLLAEVPYLKAAVGTTDAPTVQPLANDFREQINADLIIVSAPNGRGLASAGADAHLPVGAGDPQST